jgi:hypothetical protein
MESARRALEEVEQAGRRTARHPWMQALGRAGYASKGVVYAVVGALALALAVGVAGGTTTDSKGAIATIAGAPAGRTLVVLLAAGLAGLAVWLVLDGSADPGGRRRSGAWGVASRAGEVVAGLAYASLGLAALRLGAGEGAGPGGDEAARSWTARALELPAGRWLVLVAAGVAVFIGGHQIWIGLRRRFMEHLDLAGMGARLRRLAPPLGAAGFSVQGLVFVLVGLFFAQAAIEREPHEATGLDGALETIARQPLGMALLAAAALGLLAYAAFAFVEARHRRLGR